MSRRTKTILAAATLLIATAALVLAAILLSQSSPVPASSGEKQEVNVLTIGRKYVEEKYGTDYGINGDVAESTYSNGTGTWTYPTASFRVPADWQKPGLIVYVMVNPQTGEIVKTWTYWSKNLPPPNPTSNINPVNSTYLNYSSGAISKIFLVSSEPRYDIWTQNDTHMDWFSNGPVIHTGDPVFVINGTVRNDYTQNDQSKVNSDNRSIVIFNVKLYDKDSNLINALQSYPKVDSNYYKSNQWVFESGKTESFELYFSTANTNIDHYEILVELVASMPPP